MDLDESNNKIYLMEIRAFEILRPDQCGGSSLKRYAHDGYCFFLGIDDEPAFMGYKIHEILPKESCDYFGTADAQGIESELLYIGFWTDKGNADSDTLDFLSKLKNKKIFQFLCLARLLPDGSQFSAHFGFWGR